MSLLNAFVDSVVCVGFNSERGLSINQRSDKNGSPFSSFLQPYVLAILTADQAIYPQLKGNDIIDPYYPPSDYSIRKPSNRSDHASSSSLLASRTNLHKKYIIPAAVKNLPDFCHPDGVKISQQQEQDRIHRIVFTQEDGKHSYALVLTFQQTFILKTDKPDDNGIYRIDNLESSTSATKQISSSPILPPPSTESVKTHSKKIPSAYLYGNPGSTRETQPHSSNDTFKQQNQRITATRNSPIQNPTLSTSPPTSRMVRTNSQSKLFGMGDSLDGSSRMRRRADSNSSLLPNMPNRSSSGITFDTTEPFYLPHCLVLVSSHRYWTAMQEMISIIHDEILRSNIEPSSNTYKHLIQKYAFRTCNTPVPPIPWERFSLSFNITNNQSVLTFDPPISTHRSVLDLDLSTLLITLNIGKLLEVLAAIFTEQNIIFFSSNYSHLVTTLECLLYLIYPLKWIHIYIPLVPDSLQDIYLEGPLGSYIMGVHSRQQRIVENLNTTITCNLDDGKNIYLPKKLKFERIPQSKLHRFIGPITQLIEDIKKTRSLQNIHTPVRLHIGQQREFERQHRNETNSKIIEIFLNLMVDLYGDALKPIYRKINYQPLSPRTTSVSDGKNSHHDRKTIFSDEKYLLSKTEGDEREFYRIFIKSTAFQLLIEEEMESTSLTEFQKLCRLHSQSNQDQLDHFNSKLPHNQGKLTTSSFDSIPTRQMLLPLPNWPSDITRHYLDSCIEVFTTELQNSQVARSLPTTTAYAYLRGCAYLARGHLLDGLRDLYLIENPDLFPHNYIETTIVPLLADALLLELFLHEPFYIKSAEWKKIHKRPNVELMSPIELDTSGDFIDGITPVKPPPIAVPDDERNVPVEDAFTYEQFSEHVHRLRIALDRETPQILFDALLHWTNHAIKISNNTSTIPSYTNKPRRRWSLSGPTSKEPLPMRNEHQQINGNINPSSKPFIPIKLFEIFSEKWRQTNAEKERMNHYLPKDRQKQESILIIPPSNIVAIKDKPGKLILTKKGLYFLPESRSHATILTELSDIVAVDLYEHTPFFSSSKSGIKIYASHTTSTTNSSVSKADYEPSITLIFQDYHERDFWHKIIVELWSGVSIANDQRDLNILDKVSRHIELIDTLTTIDYKEDTTATTSKQSTNSLRKIKQHNHKATIEMALKDFLIFTRVRQASSFKTLPVETREVLTHRLIPSTNETENHAVRCLIFTENPDNENTSLWCAYGRKLKIFNVKTWICDPTDISFPSLITCMCLDACYKLWIGCADGQLFVVDTLTPIRGVPLASIDGEGGCQTIALDIERNQILVSNRTGLTIVWNAANCQRLIDIDLREIFKKTYNTQHRTYRSEATLKLRSLTQESTINISSSTGAAEVIPTISDKLKSIQIYENLLFASYHEDYILIFRMSDSNTYVYDDIVSVKYNKDGSIVINSFLAYNKQLWISASFIIYIININNKKPYELIMKKPLDNDHLLTMLGFSSYIWAGSSCGNVYVFRMDNYELLKTFTGHKDGVCSLCSMLDMYVISGSGQDDTSIVVWENTQTSNNLNAPLITKR